jgi:hypothetical protein
LASLESILLQTITIGAIAISNPRIDENSGIVGVVEGVAGVGDGVGLGLAVGAGRDCEGVELGVGEVEL